MLGKCATEGRDYIFPAYLAKWPFRAQLLAIVLLFLRTLTSMSVLLVSKWCSETQ